MTRKNDPLEEMAEQAAYMGLMVNSPGAIEAIKTVLETGGTPRDVLRMFEKKNGKGFLADTFYYAAKYIRRTG